MIRYLFGGLLFGFVLVKSEVISWFRIQEMFRFDDFHMYGILGSAVIVAAVSLKLMKYFELTNVDGNRVTTTHKDASQVTRYLLGGTIFGFGWALTGACPGPLYALTGTGLLIFLVPLASAVAGTWMYGLLREKMPH